MRVIKFRVWVEPKDGLSGEMLCWDDICSSGDATEILEGRYRDCHPMQFTGLLDVNGKEIYEGDILRLFYPRDYGFGGTVKEEKLVTIIYQNGGFWFTGGGVTDCNWHFYNTTDCEVVGNKYENPELLSHSDNRHFARQADEAIERTPIGEEISYEAVQEISNDEA